MRIENAPTEVDGARGAVRSVDASPRRVALEVDASMATVVVVLDGAFPGWTAAVDGRPADVLSAGHYRAVWVPAGTSRVAMEYRPRGLVTGTAVSVLSVLASAGLWLAPARVNRDLAAA